MMEPSQFINLLNFINFIKIAFWDASENNLFLKTYKQDLLFIHYVTDNLIEIIESLLYQYAVSVMPIKKC